VHRESNVSTSCATSIGAKPELRQSDSCCDQSSSKKSPSKSPSRTAPWAPLHQLAGATTLAGASTKSGREQTCRSMAACNLLRLWVAGPWQSPSTASSSPLCPRASARGGCRDRQPRNAYVCMRIHHCAELRSSHASDAKVVQRWP
jgi:hypothetical protein